MSTALVPDVQVVRVPKHWVRKLLKTGDTTDLTPGQLAEIERRANELSKTPEGLAVLAVQLTAARERVKELKDNAADNIRKSTSTQSTATTILFAVLSVAGAVVLSRNPWVVIGAATLGAVAVALLGSAIIIPVVAFKPKNKCWRPPGLSSTILANLRAAQRGQQYAHLLRKLAETEHHWKQLLLVERRVLHVEARLTAWGSAIVYVTMVIAAIVIAVRAALSL